MGRGDFTQIPNGTGGLEDRLWLFWRHDVATGRIKMNEFVAVTSTNIARILNVTAKRVRLLLAQMPIPSHSSQRPARPSLQPPQNL
jgi:dihydropyrimidinase